MAPSDNLARRSGPLGGLDLGPLYLDCLLRSCERRETYDAIASELCDYGLQWGGAPVDALAYRCHVGGLSAYSMRYGDEVMVRPDLYDGFLLAHLSVRKGIEIESDNQIFSLPEGSVFFSAPRRSIALRWQEGCEQVIIRIPYALLGLEGRPNDLATGTRLPGHMVRPFSHQLNGLLALARHPADQPSTAEWQGLFLRSLIGSVAVALEVGGPASDPVRLPAPGTKDRRAALEEFIVSRLDRPIQLSDLERSAGLGHSQLSALCHEAFGCSPMALVRKRRLEAVRQALESDPAQDLTGLSLRFGFEHQGRFSQYYRAEFGETPSDTRRRLRGAVRTGKTG